MKDYLWTRNMNCKDHYRSVNVCTSTELKPSAKKVNSFKDRHYKLQ